MARSTVHYADNKTNNILKALHNKLRPAGTPVMRVEYIIELLLLRIFEVKLKRDAEFAPLRKLFDGDNYRLLFSHFLSLNGNQALSELNKNVFAFYGNILGKARDVYKKNLPQKVQDQLVLIEEVFFNSNFNNNVKNGNLSDIVGLVNDIDEERLLKTDLLGDAIESALSEQGGTKDVGLYRTPDHIRQMMVVMADPDFKDIIFDPACGTGGFLFDAFQYVLEKVGKDGNWPGEKAHKEIKKYLVKYIKNIEPEMPSSNMANTFYRVGISGIEYLGMIRKMAAINLYIRGLNPANIEQGDSLDIFDPGVDAGTKSVVIANPPFGAKLDQPAYPKVWEEYPKTDSTTLFVRLMFNHLKNGGRCAVVVSEGFLTWDNEPAKEMRKMLIEECNLRAIISLPQGVFVSKNGQGAKTSILYYEKPSSAEATAGKGEPTKNVWFYKITNDGYSMGVNRKEIVGCQIPEVLELFTKYVKRGKIPPKTKNSFVIPAEWIKQIDPRLKLRIITETTEQQKQKFAEKRKKEIEKLDERLKKEKIGKKEYKEKVWQFDNVVENNIQNEIAKRIEKAHSYFFNLQNYRSNLRDEQIKKWQNAFKEIKIKNGSNIEARYQELLQVDNKTALQILASFNP
ncbi:SAM-dependent methyltransferase, partial [Patescibacteria group bacterium]|nr:SAM-dependent methyltransferase [Patescibacteria group bacterium]